MIANFLRRPNLNRTVGVMECLNGLFLFATQPNPRPSCITYWTAYDESLTHFLFTKVSYYYYYPLSFPGVPRVHTYWLRCPSVAVSLLICGCQAFFDHTRMQQIKR